MINKIISTIGDSNISSKFNTLHILIKSSDPGVNGALRQAEEAILKHILEIEKNNCKKLKTNKNITCSEMLKDKAFRNVLSLNYNVSATMFNALSAIIYDGNKSIHENHNVFEKNNIKHRYKYLIILLISILNTENIFNKKIKMTEKEINDEFDSLFEKTETNNADENRISKISIEDIKRKDDDLKNIIKSIDDINEMFSNEKLIYFYEIVTMTDKYLKQIKTDEISNEEFENRIYKNFYKLKCYIENVYYTINCIENKTEILYTIMMYLYDIKEELYEEGFSIFSWLKEPPKIKLVENFGIMEKIAKCIEECKCETTSKWLIGRFYINNIKPFFVDEKIYFQIDIQKATNQSNHKNGINRVYTTINIKENYAVNLRINVKKVQINGTDNDIYIMTDYKTSIRPIEIINLIHILTGIRLKNSISSSDVFYQKLNSYLDENNTNLYEVVIGKEFDNFIKYIKTSAEASILFCEGLIKARKIIKEDKYESGANILRYLICFTRNRVLEKQMLDFTLFDMENDSKDENIIKSIERNKNNVLLLESKLFLKKETNAFDRTPLSAHLISHKTLLRNLMMCINVRDRQCEIFRRCLEDYCNTNQTIYAPILEFNKFENIDDLMEAYNRNQLDKIKKKDNYIYIQKNEIKIKSIINTMNVLMTKHTNYEELKNNFFKKYSNEIDINRPINKKQSEILHNSFKETNILLLYGAAGTGKTELICNYYTKLFINSDYKITYISNTHSAKNNMKNRVKKSLGDELDNYRNNLNFYVVSKYKMMKMESDDADVLIIDESKSIANDDLCMLLKKICAKKYVIMTGDIGQIEAIRLGNWFSILYGISADNSKFELLENHRTDNAKLFEFWKKIRNKDKDIVEYMIENNYIEQITDDVYSKKDEDEAIICWNYGGFYGINSMNSYMQEKNDTRVQVEYEMEKFKKGDPIVFNKIANSFAYYYEKGDVIYNNLKGILKWVEIKEYENHKYFEFEIFVNDYIGNINNETVRKELFPNSEIYQIESKMSSKENNSTIIIIRTKTNKEYLNEEFVDIPFDIAYAMSLHKAQGLEYNSVKLVITPESEELFNNEAFYTAITRAKKYLKIYTTTMEQEKLIDIFSNKTIDKDIELLQKVDENC